MKKIWLLVIIVLVGCSKDATPVTGNLEIDVQTMERETEAAEVEIVEVSRPWIRVYVDLLNVRSAPVNGEVLGKLKEGYIFEATDVTEIEGKPWYKINFDGKEGYVAGWLCQTVLKKDTVLDGVPMVFIPILNQMVYDEHLITSVHESHDFTTDYLRIFETYYDDQSTIWYKIQLEPEVFKWIVGTTYEVHIMDPTE